MDNDIFLPENDEKLVIHFQKGKPKVISNKEEFDVEISIEIARFSSLIMGAVSFKRLYEYNLVQITDKKYIGLLDKLFRTEEPPFTIEPF